MSANLDLVRSIYADWERGDFSRADWADPEIEFIFADGPQPGGWKGLAGMAEGWRDFLSTWEDFRAEAEDFCEIDSERLLVLLHSSGRGKLSGLNVEQMSWKTAHIVHVREGKVSRFVNYFDRDRALADLGLEE